MCFSSKSKTPTVEATPAPAPTPTIVSPSTVEGQVSGEERRRKLERMRQGLVSTIKTSSKGITGSGADLSQQMLSGKDKLGQ